MVKEERAEIGGYFQNLAEEFSDFSSFLKDDGCDVVKFLHCPESEESEEDIREYFEDDDEVTEEQIQASVDFTRLITTEAYFPIREVQGSFTKARGIVADYGEERFHHGKEGLLAELDELIEELSQVEDDSLEILLLRG